MSDSPCFICQRNPAVKDIPRYRFAVCRICWDENWAGWEREHEARILKHLESERLSVPTRNITHLFPRGG
jgi:hypothetical protein